VLPKPSYIVPNAIQAVFPVASSVLSAYNNTVSTSMIPSSGASSAF
jgi:hypothetical protein